MDTTDNRVPERLDAGRAPPVELYQRIRARIEETPAPRTGTRARVIIALIVAPCAALIALAIASNLVYQQFAVGLDVSARSTGNMLLQVLLLAALTLAATFVAVRRSRIGSGIGSLAFTVALVAPIYGVLTLANPLHAADPLPPSVVLSYWGARCIVLAGIVGAAVLATLTAALLRAVPVASGLRGTALGAAAGAWAGLTVFLFCPAGDYPHLIVGHVLPVFALTLLGAVGIPRMLRP